MAHEFGGRSIPMASGSSCGNTSSHDAKSLSGAEPHHVQTGQRFSYTTVIIWIDGLLKQSDCNRGVSINVTRSYLVSTSGKIHFAYPRSNT